LVEDSDKTEAHPIAVNQPYALTTNSQGVISFALPAEALMAPVLRIAAPFMIKDHALLIFPDRQAHHKLSQVTEEELLNKKVVMEAGGEPVPMVSEEFRDSAPHLAQAIRHFMGVATEKAPQSNNPVVRPVEDRLREVVAPPIKRQYENATASPDAYNPITDAISGYVDGAGQTSISRSLSVNQMPDWEFKKKETGASTIAASRTNLSSTKTSTLTWVDGLKAQTHDWLEKLKSNASEHKSAIKDEAAPGHRANVKGSYLQHLVGTHGKDASLDGQDDGPDPTQAQEKLDKIRKDNELKVSHINGALTNLLRGLTTARFMGRNCRCTVISSLLRM